MKSIAEITGRQPRRKKVDIKPVYSFVLPDTLMGVELEVDNDRGSNTVFPNVSGSTRWNKIRDGSLANGYEYVLARPLAGDELSIAISELYHKDAKVFRTFTGSTHIHMDMLESDTTMEILRTMFLLVYTLEPMLYATGDVTREWCGYANSIKQAPSDVLASLFADDETHLFHNILGGGALGRYYGMNLAALNRYGSVEFRYFPTAESPEEMVKWINLVQSFKAAAKDIGTVVKLKEIIADKQQFVDMMDKYFSEYKEEQEALGGWKNVSSMLAKAMVEVEVPKMKQQPRYLINDEFLRNRFGSLVEFSPTVEASANGLPEPDLDMVHNHTAQDYQLPDPQPGHILKVGNSIYVCHNSRWVGVSDIVFADIVVDQQTRSNLSAALEAGMFDTYWDSSSANCILRAIIETDRYVYTYYSNLIEELEDDDYDEEF